MCIRCEQALEKVTPTDYEELNAIGSEWFTKLQTEFMSKYPNGQVLLNYVAIGILNSLQISFQTLMKNDAIVLQSMMQDAARACMIMKYKETEKERIN
jgi:hypothetical protein